MQPSIAKVILGLAGIGVAWPSTTFARVVVDVVGVSEVSGRVTLRMQVVNCGDTPIKAPLGLLPWGDYALGLTLRRHAQLPGAAISERGLLRHSDPIDLDIPPKRAVEGSIDLRERFPELDGIAKGEGFVIFWTYNTSLLIKHGGAQISGAIDVTKESIQRKMHPKAAHESCALQFGAKR